MKLAILVDQPHWTGIGIYAVELYKLLKTYFDDVKLIYAGAVEDDQQYYLYRPYLRRTRVLLRRPSVIRRNYRAILRDRSLDSYLFHYAGTDFFPLRRREGVITIHDLIEDRLLPSVRFGFLKVLVTLERRRKYSETLRLAPMATEIITISNKTRNELKVLTGLESTVIYHWIVGDRFRERDRAQSIRELSLKEEFRYFLAVGNDRGNKRIDLLKKFSDSLPSQYRLVKIGAPIDSQRAINVGRVNSYLYPLYFNASSAYVHLSDDEGFGIPLLEALGSKVPIICRKTSINMEVLNDAAIYIREESINKQISSIIKETESEKFIDEIKRKMTERIKAFSPKLAAEKYIEVYFKSLSKLKSLEHPNSL